VLGILMRPEVLLVCAERWVSATRLPVLFRRAGARVTLIAGRDTMVRRTWMANRRILVDAKGAKPVFEAALEELRRHPGLYTMVQWGDDPLLDLAVARADDPMVRATLPIDTGLAPPELLSSKETSFRLAAEAGVAVPEWRACATRREALEVGRAIGYPVFSKPLDGFGGNGIAMCRTEAELAAYWGGMPAGGGRIIIQRYIDGQHRLIEFVADGKRLLAWRTSHSIQRRSRYGGSTARLPLDQPELAEAVEAIVRRTGYRGYGSAEFIIEDRTGILYYMENQWRPGAGPLVWGQQGVDFVQAMRAFLANDTDAPVQRPRPVGPRPGIFPLFPEEMRRRLGQGEWLGALGLLAHPIPWLSYPWPDLGVMRACWGEAYRGWCDWRAARKK